MRQKAILFTFRGIQGINAETVVARHYELKALVEHFKRVEDVDSYAIPHDNLKPTMNWSVEWGPKEDARLLIGIWRYGFGAWDLIKSVSIETVPVIPIAWLIVTGPRSSIAKHDLPGGPQDERSRRS